MAIAMAAETFSGNLFSITLLLHFHPPSAFPYPSAFALRWKQAEKVEANFASTCLKRRGFAVTTCLLA
ncbi:MULTISPECIES: hypothetical protein [Bacteroides]|nr:MULTISPECIES: hypothetical protein [Bacteroides]